MSKKHTTSFGYFIVLFLFYGALNVNAQCVAEAGRDTSFCGNLPANGDLIIGGSPTYSPGGTAFYSWYLKEPYVTAGFNQYASNLLDDTTAANPALINSFLLDNGPVTFYVDILTGGGEEDLVTCTDSVTLNISPDPYISSGENIPVTITIGDSVQLSSVITGGAAPFTYSWSPASSVRDSSDVNTWAFPDSTTNYRLTITDANDCTVEDNFHVSVVPECNIDAGSDATLCISDFSTNDIELGGSPTYIGTTNVEYSWYTKSEETPHLASNLLNDTIRPNPRLVSTEGLNSGPITFYVDVHLDSTICTDSITIQVIMDSYISTLENKEVTIDLGDSIQLYSSISGGTEPITYLWSPSGSLTEPSDVETWANPSTTTDFNLLITDSAGCVAEDNFMVTVIDTTTNIASIQGSEALSIYPNPFVSQAILSFEYSSYEDLSIVFYDAQGKKSNTLKITGPNTLLLKENFGNAGVFFYEVFEHKKLLLQGKLTVR